jgi:predicted metal-binding protein
MKKSLTRLVDKLPNPETLYRIYLIHPLGIPLDAMARLKCFQCGLMARAILCPPYLAQTYPQFRTLETTKKFFSKFKKAVVFVWKNDGTKSWKIDKRELGHIDFRIKKGKELKGTEIAQSRELSTLMRNYRKEFRKNGFDCFGFIAGHCDFCGGKCPERDEPPCNKGGMPSLEAVGIDVYKMLENLQVEYQHPVEDFLTQVTMLLVGRK